MLHAGKRGASQPASPCNVAAAANAIVAATAAATRDQGALPAEAPRAQLQQGALPAIAAQAVQQNAVPSDSPAEKVLADQQGQDGTAGTTVSQGGTGLAVSCLDAGAFVLHSGTLMLVSDRAATLVIAAQVHDFAGCTSLHAHCMGTLLHAIMLFEACKHADLFYELNGVHLLCWLSGIHLLKHVHVEDRRA